MEQRFHLWQEDRNPQLHLTYIFTCDGAKRGEGDDCHPNEADAVHQEYGVHGPRHGVYCHRGNLPRGGERAGLIILRHEPSCQDTPRACCTVRRGETVDRRWSRLRFTRNNFRVLVSTIYAKPDLPRVVRYTGWPIVYTKKLPTVPRGTSIPARTSR